MIMVRAHSFKSIPFIHLYTEFKLTKSETHTNSISVWCWNCGCHGRRGHVLLWYQGVSKNRIFEPYGLCCDSEWNIIIADSKNDRIDKDGGFLHYVWYEGIEIPRYWYKWQCLRSRMEHCIKQSYFR